MADYTDLDPARLKPGLVTPNGDLKPGLVTPNYSGGTPSNANQVKPSLLTADGQLKPGVAKWITVSAVDGIGSMAIGSTFVVG